MNICLNCGGSAKAKYCSNACRGDWLEEQSIKEWLAGDRVGHKGIVKNVKPFVRKYLMRKYASSCCKCHWNTPHPASGIPPLEINHIDGNAENTVEKNLELLCPNCHSLTLNFKNRNKGKGNRKR